MQVAAKPGKAWVAAVGQFHFQQVEHLGLGLEFPGHVVVENSHATLGFDLPQRIKLPRNLSPRNLLKPNPKKHQKSKRVEKVKMFH